MEFFQKVGMAHVYYPT